MATASTPLTLFPSAIARLNFIARVPLLIGWLLITFAIGLVWAFFRWKSPKYNPEMGRIWGKGALYLLGIRLKVEGRKHLSTHRPCVFIINHQSLLDGISIGELLPEGGVIIARRGVGWIPFFGFLYRAGGNILIDRENRRNSLGGLQKAAERLKKKRQSAIIFPEGTLNRSAYGRLIPFKKGAFHLARMAGAQLVPIVCEPHRHIIDFQNGRLFGGTLHLRVLPPIETQSKEFQGPSLEPLMRHSHTVMSEALAELSSPRSLPRE
jgi:1-acyl-sn-glycerol-3-phosphate acyltransferase